MRIISLNTWGGRAGEEDLLKFFEAHRDTTDIFCLQEIWAKAYTHLDGHVAGGVVIKHENIMTEGLQRISAALPNHVPFFRPHHGDNYGLLMLVHKKLMIAEEGELFVYKYKDYVPDGDVGNHARNIQYVTIETETGPLTVINFHGLWNGKGKTDSEDRIQQSKNILDFMETLKGEYILCGDFNLLPDTESLKLFEVAGLRNLIKEYTISSTRTSFYTKPEKHADYAFVTKGLDITDFKVLPDAVSDHAPLLIEVKY
jgi:endonuclease/exonuclease/phosphatase family metal-dependent hydrolase